MIDYLFCFPDEDTAFTALGFFNISNPPVTNKDGTITPGVWNPSCALPVKVEVSTTVIGTDPDSGEDITAPVYASGYWLVVTTAWAREELYALPYCMREANRDLALAGEPYVMRERFTPEQLATPWVITPQWCGVNYSNQVS